VHKLTHFCISGVKRSFAEANISASQEDIKLAHMFETLGLSAEKANEVLKVLKSV
jgi:N-acetylmuramic acid 6-phosphate (MurNAc-6-P) etherase